MTLESKVEEAKEFYKKKYGKLDWHYNDEGLVYTIMDYLSSMGQFTKKDYDYAEKEGINDYLEEALILHEECEAYSR